MEVKINTGGLPGGKKTRKEIIAFSGAKVQTIKMNAVTDT